MGTELTTTGGAALAVTPGQTMWTDDQLAVLRHMSTDKATAADLQVFLHRCQQLELDPFAGQIHLVEYGGKPTIQVGIHGLESCARSAADRAGVQVEWEPVQWCGPDEVWREVWLGEEPPAAARAVLLRDGRRFPAVAVYREFVGMRKVYENNNRWTGRWEVNSMWAGKPAHMLGKCARAAALRMAFPRQLAQVFAPEELGQRPTVLVGDDGPPPGGPVVAGPDRLDAALALVASAVDRQELVAIWEQEAPGLSVGGRAVLQRACTDAAAAVDAAGAGVADEVVS
jgi:phage recombination protein Bet